MLLQNWKAFLVGYVTIVIEGVSLEKFINLALIRGILLWDMIPISENRIRAKVTVPGVPALRHVARITHCRFRIKDKRGLPFLWRKVKKRKMLHLGALGFICLLYLLSAFIWFVDLTSEEELQYLTSPQILEFAAGLGLKPGAFKGNLDLKTIETTMAVKLPQLSWVSIEIQGTHALINVVEKVFPSREQLDRNPGHVVAAQDGVIKEILVINGMSRVKEGDTVSRGQVLISGIVAPEALEGVEREQLQGAPRLVRARGIVRARVWYQASAQAPLVATGVNPTGRQVTVTGLKIADRTIVLKGPRTISYKHYEQQKKVEKLPGWRNWQVPVELIRTTYFEVEPYTKEFGEDGAKRLAFDKALALIKEQLPQGSKVVDRKFITDPPEQGIIKAKLIIEVLEEIGKFQPIT